MTTKETLVKKTKLSDVIKTEAVVDMNSVVAFFISKYENALLKSQKELSKKIFELRNYINEDFLKEVETEIKIDSYKITVKSLGLVTTATVRIQAHLLETKKKVLVIISQSDKSKDCQFRGEKTVAISDELRKKYFDTLAEVDSLCESLNEVLENIQNISRKERELCGTLAEKTLRDAGVGELFDDEALLNLVKLPQLSMKTVK